jgi:hypothetical protein
MPADALMMGDFNFEWSAPEYDRIVGPPTTRFGRLNRITSCFAVSMVAYRCFRGAMNLREALLLNSNVQNGRPRAPNTNLGSNNE